MDISKLCRSDIDKLCAYCINSSDSIDEKLVLCKISGMVDKTHSCKKFKYSPLKRTPPKRVQMKRNFKAEDFDI